MDGFDLYSYSIVAVFLIGYLSITLESYLRINKATSALMMAVVCWAIVFAEKGVSLSNKMIFLGQHLANISQVIFFLLGALTVVEVINVHKGFRLVTDCIKIRSKRKLLWLIGFITFFLSAILDNLATTIVMVSLISRMVESKEERLLLGGAIVIAANAGGAWTPIGDVTTTMLWIGGQITSYNIMMKLFFPSLVCLISSLLILTFNLRGSFSQKQDMHLAKKQLEPRGQFIFFLGLGCLVFVPIFKAVTGLPPFMGILFGLSVMWLVTDLIHCKHEDREHLRVPYVLSKVDLSGAFFFLGILLCVNALETIGILDHLAQWLDRTIQHPEVIATSIGVISSIVDNVPLVAGTMAMYDFNQYPPDARFWEMMAYCAGTGGSILVIGSAAGVAFMGLEKVDFLWYIKKISFPAIVGYFLGIGMYLLLWS